MSQGKLKNIIEAALMVATQPLSVARILNIFEADQTQEPERDDIRNTITSLQEDYAGRGIELAEVASGFRFQARNEYAEWVNHLFDERPPRYSRALFETLAIIAYRQPVTRGEIEEIRGVIVSSTIVKTLQDREWVKVVGHRDVPGKPALLATTKSFLDYFNLRKLSDLPSLEDIKDFDLINPDLFEGLKGETKAKAQDETQLETDEQSDTETENVDMSATDDQGINLETGKEESNEDENETEATGETQGTDDNLKTVAIKSDEESEIDDGAKAVPFTN